jgi:hypothetical protein
VRSPISLARTDKICTGFLDDRFEFTSSNF